jgi:hypothetical protein
MLACSYAINMGAYLSDNADHNINMHHNVGEPKENWEGHACISLQ